MIEIISVIEITVRSMGKKKNRDEEKGKYFSSGDKKQRRKIFGEEKSMVTSTD